MIKRFIASSVEKAQAKARKAFGRNVVILSIRDLPSGDVEVAAADEEGARAYYADPQNRNAPVSPQPPGAASPSDSPAHEDKIAPQDTAPRGDRRKPGRLGRIPFFNRRKDDPGFNERADEPPVHGPEAESLTTADRHEPLFDEEPLFSEGPPHFDEPPVTNPAGDDPYQHRTGRENADQNAGQNTAAAAPIPARSVSPGQPLSAPLTATPAPRAAMGADPASGGGSRLNEPLEQKFGENNLSQLRERLTGQRGPGDSAMDDPGTSSLAALLSPHGVSDRLLAMIRNGARQAQVDDELYRLGMGFAETFNFSPLRSTAAVPLMLVGPTGAGKTSCAAKLAALALAEGETAIMITTDVGRAGALEQFATYSEKLNIECYAAETPDEIALIMRETKPQGAVILDTPGISPYDAGDLAALKSYQTAIGAEPVLVLPASGDVGEYTDWAHAFRAFGVRCCIITKFDATRRVGAGLSAAFEGNMTLTYFSETPFISEGLLPASPEYLAYRLTASYPGRIVQA
ncbi:MAG: hypothetical protein AAGL18_10450 [Pseudomonadota bacterium]